MESLSPSEFAEGTPISMNDWPRITRTDFKRSTMRRSGVRKSRTASLKGDIHSSTRNGSIITSTSVPPPNADPNKKQNKEITVRPGLRAMLYGLTMKMEREEANMRKLQKKMHVQEEKAMQSAPSAPIDATKFVAYVTERRKKRILFRGEYLMILRSIDPTKCTTEIGSRMGERNQYSDTLPYDNTRVVLSIIDDDPDSHYINASYVHSWLREKAYIVTQAVKTKNASNDFWRMVWEQRSIGIVMLTKVFDFMRVMCVKYWPLNRFQFRHIEVEMLETKTYAHFVIRTFRLRNLEDPDTSNTRIVKHFHFTEWELNSFPYVSAFIELRRRVRQWMDANPTDAPLIVHCSNGGGRSGAFLALDANLELLKKTGQVDIYEYAKTMVNCRQHLIDHVDQYMFIYDVLCEALLCNIEPIPIYKLKQRSSMYRSRKDRELMELQDNHENKLLLMLTSSLRIGDCAGGHRLENRGKNRDVMVVPPDHARPYLQTLHGESKDYTYINAVEVDGFTRKSEFIVTEWPKQQTIDSFWTLIFDHSCHTVVNLTNPSNDKIYPHFIHNKGKKNYGPFTVEILNYQQYPGMTSHMVKIMKRNFDEQQQPPPSQLTPFCCLRKKQIVRRPTLKEFLKDESKNNNGLPAGQTFRMDQRYWGKIRSASETPKVHSKESMKLSQALKEGGQRIVRSASKLAKWAQAPRGQRAFSQPNSDTLAQFEKPSEPFKSDPEKQTRGDVSKLTFMISEIMATGATQQQMEAEIRICCVIQVKMWPLENKVPLSTTSMIELIKMTRAWRKRAPDRPETKPTVVMSHNGVSRCGIFIAANVCIDQMDMDNEVDVFHAVKMIRINRPQLIDMKDEYKYLYDLMLHWYMTDPDYRAREPQETEELEEEEDLEQYTDALEDTNLSPRRRSTRRSSSRSRPRLDTSQQNNNKDVNNENRRSRSVIRRDPVYLND